MTIKTIRKYTATITGFYFSDNDKLVVNFTFGDRKLRADAHPAFQVKPHIGKEQEICVAETDAGWKLVSPRVTEADIKAYEEAKAKREAEIVKLTKKQEEVLLAYITF